MRSWRVALARVPRLGGRAEAHELAHDLRGAATAAAPRRAVLSALHEDHIHDCQWDYYARRLATASSDRTVKVWNVEAESHALSATLTGHDGPVWEVAWAHPQYGTVLASCSYDGTAPQPVSINSIEFAPSAFGQLILACASSDGHVTVLRHDGGGGGARTGSSRARRTNAVSWAPLGVNGSTRDDGSPILRLATGSADCLVKVWSPLEQPCWRANWSVTGNILAVSSGDDDVSMWKETIQGEWFQLGEPEKLTNGAAAPPN
ncbi:hypothetical protein JL720_11392 [Aureococcus anophagefferens]|nr:hypothetical protein JL720_11392 [Aureococcus anophagefferens]